MVAILGECFTRTDAKLIAYVVMPNHFHVVLRQGELQLSHVMQRICRGIAMAVNKDLGREGYVFERRYRAKACLDPDYLRDVIAYVHLNPRKAGLCNDPGDYEWSSHREYAGIATNHTAARIRPRLTAALELFCTGEPQGASDRQRAYLEYLAWREMLAATPDYQRETPLIRPRFDFGDRYWREYFATLALPEDPRPDLRDIVLRVLANGSPHIDLQMLRLRRGGSRIVNMRHRAIEQAFLAGHRGVDIARFLDISETTVSKVCTRLVASRKGGGQPDRGM